MGCTIPGCGSSGHNRRTHDKHVPPGEPLDPTRFLVGERGPVMGRMVDGQFQPESVPRADHECEPAPDQVYYCRHCGGDLMVPLAGAPEPVILDTSEPRTTESGLDEFAPEVVEAVSRIGDEMVAPHGPGCTLADPCDECRRHVARPVYERFLTKVDRSMGPDACHLWTATRTARGYGQFRVNGSMVYAHRWVAGYLRGSPLNADELALHSCDNPPCVNPGHLHIGDQKQNMRECVERGRADLAGLELGRVPGKTLGHYRVGPEQCGTVKGYNRHRRHGEQTCSACRSAAAAYNRVRKAARK